VDGGKGGVSVVISTRERGRMVSVKTKTSAFHELGKHNTKVSQVARQSNEIVQ